MKTDDGADWRQQEESEHERFETERGTGTMGFVVKDTGGGDYEIAPSGNHLAIAYLLVDIGTQDTPFGTKQQLLLGWELCREIMEDGRPFGLSSFYTRSLSAKSNLHRDLVSWRGREFTTQELEGFDLENILGKPCLLNVVHDTNEQQRTRAKVAGVTKLPKGTEVPEQLNPSVVYHIEDKAGGAFDNLPEWIQGKIKDSQEWRGIEAPAPEAAPDWTPDDFDDEIPF